MNTLPAPALAARSAALKVLRRALSSRDGFELALADPALLQLPSQDRAFARALAMTVLRRLGPIDQALGPRLQREPPQSIRDLLRIGLAQTYWMDTPAYAAVDTTVALTPQTFRGLVNAVLRGQIRDGPPHDDPEALAPAWLFARWRASYGEETARAISRTIADEPATDLTPRATIDDPLLAALEATRLAGGSLRTSQRGDIVSWPGYAEGAWWVQDVAAAIPARVLESGPGDRVLDVCAAPGGKTLQLAAAGCLVTALDRSRARLSRLSANLTRLRLEAEVVVSDAVAWTDERLFDSVLLDAPCSATGAFRRHPDVLWNAKPGDIATLAAVQTALIAASARRVRPGGRMVYSVCSLEAEEGELQVRAFLSGHPEFALEPFAPGEGGAPGASLTPDGWLRILPHHLEGGIDGFFIARLRARG